MTGPPQKSNKLDHLRGEGSANQGAEKTFNHVLLFHFDSFHLHSQAGQDLLQRREVIIARVLKVEGLASAVH